MTSNGLELDQLQPYKSIILGEIDNGGVNSDLVEECLADIREILNLEEDRGSMARNREEIASGDNIGSPNEDLDHGFIHYELEKDVPWTSNKEITDIENHLVLLTIQRDMELIALYASENSRRRSIREKFGDDGCSGLKNLKQIAPETLNAAFFGNEVRTLWMSGMHRRVPVKADSKILTGPDLRYALNPINDQTFYYSAARSRHSELGNAVGISPKKSRVWTQRSSNWADYWESVLTILQQLDDEKESERRPLPVLAEYADTSEVGNPYDLVIQPPELLSEDAEVEERERERLEVWAYETQFDVTDESTLGQIAANVEYMSQKIGEISINLDMSDPRNVEIEGVSAELTKDELPEGLAFDTIEVDNSDDTSQEDAGESKDPLFELKMLCEDPELIKIYYDSGHTLTNGSFYKAGYRDQTFDDFIWADFDNYNITKEKPTETDFPSEGNDISWDEEPSLFKWVYDNWPPSEEPWNGGSGGWLACDDGSREVADFVHLTTESAGPVITLIHVKSAGSDSSGREISVAQYEKVTGQAVKNLRNLDHETLGSGLIETVSTKIGSLVWNDGEPADRTEMVAELEDLGTDYERRVVIIQPHVQRSHREEVLEEDDTQDDHRLKQLDTLLHGAKNACSGLGAEFLVISSNE